jgi:hypothetical protein
MKFTHRRVLMPVSMECNSKAGTPEAGVVKRSGPGAAGAAAVEAVGRVQQAHRLEETEAAARHATARRGCMGSMLATWSRRGGWGLRSVVTGGRPLRGSKRTIRSRAAAHAEPGVRVRGAVQAEEAIEDAGHQVHAGTDVLSSTQFDLGARTKAWREPGRCGWWTVYRPRW